MNRDKIGTQTCYVHVHVISIHVHVPLLIGTLMYMYMYMYIACLCPKSCFYSFLCDPYITLLNFYVLVSCHFFTIVSNNSH